MGVVDEVVDEDPTAPAQLRKVRQEWNQELVAHQRAAGQELETLRLRHLQDLEEARRAGAGAARRSSNSNPVSVCCVHDVPKCIHFPTSYEGQQLS